MEKKVLSKPVYFPCKVINRKKPTTLHLPVPTDTVVSHVKKSRHFLITSVFLAENLMH